MEGEESDERRVRAVSLQNISAYLYELEVVGNVKR